METKAETNEIKQRVAPAASRRSAASEPPEVEGVHDRNLTLDLTDHAKGTCIECYTSRVPSTGGRRHPG